MTQQAREDKRPGKGKQLHPALAETHDLDFSIDKTLFDAVLNDEQFKEWQSSTDTWQLRFSGSPGCGKTTLASIIMEKLRETAPCVASIYLQQDVPSDEAAFVEKFLWVVYAQFGKYVPGEEEGHQAGYGMADSCYEYDTSEGEVCVTPRPLSESRLPHHHEARHVVDATEDISAILMQKLEGFQEDLRLYQWEKSRSRDELQNMKNEMMQDLCMAKEQMLEELASATMTRMEGVEACLPRPPSEPRPRTPSPRQPGPHAVPGKVTEDATEDVTEDATEAAPEAEPLQVELPPNAKLASQIAPSRRYMHDKREKDKTRKSGESLQRKVLVLGEMCNVFSLTMYWNIVHARMEMAMYVPGGQKIPNLDQVVQSLRGRQARVTQRARVFRTSRLVQKPSFKSSHTRNTGRGSAGPLLRSQRRHSEGAGHPSPQPMASLTGRPPSTQDNIDGSSAVQQGAQTTHPPRDGVAEGSAAELSMGCNERLDSPMYDAVAGDANGFEVSDAAIGTGMVATAGASQPTALEPDRNGDTIGSHQEMEGLHDQDGHAGDSSAKMPNTSPMILAQETDAGGAAAEGPRGPQPRCGSPFVGDSARAASLCAKTYSVCKAQAGFDAERNAKCDNDRAQCLNTGSAVA
ncbi:hypothetical protein PG999_004457 [Apiospora kogelbergensis]|uniref:Nephrocystin 3-like N-terminal domain-containing protein n=1 Tax=Apiospora kogelbergensis TaxID=1337665 RepID=A0AAW0QZD3_9PEZI